jgi:E3 ubiquitin-protein ligase SHPRH
LYGLLVFLDYPLVANNGPLWTRICHDWSTFQKIFRPLTCRNTKHNVKDELTLPPQTRALLSLDFTAIEEINYQHIFEQMLDDCGLTPTGHPLRSNWELTDRITEKMKKWLGANYLSHTWLMTVRLRQACSHPGVGTWRSGNKEMRTMDEVLDKMYEDTCAALSRDERELFITRLKKGQIYDHCKDHEQALLIWGEVLEEVAKRALRKLDEVQRLKSDLDSDAESTSSIASTFEESCKEELKAKKVKSLRTRRGNELRDLQDLQHRATFMMASANFQLKNEKEEISLYEEAEKLRREVSKISSPWSKTDFRFSIIQFERPAPI